MLSVKEYAKLRNISYEAARQSILHHKKELDGHIIKQGKTRYLDETAVELMDQWRVVKLPNLSVVEPSKEETIDGLKNEVIRLNQQLVSLYERIDELQEESKKGIEARARVELLESSAQSAKEEQTALKNELDRYKPFIFGLYRKK